MKLIYIGDPMYSWCYGFGKQLSSLLVAMPTLSLEIIVGGARVDNVELRKRCQSLPLKSKG